ncbi:hypothetical protein VX037_14530 [Gordonia sp. Z-3]|jgi:hypothetical protein|uniref:hypothetical protein n=1 Tax=Gordonia sp. Z-3 TaxID=3115408 RepID=UPI002E27E7AC|nr:hypothetical protein [Gordonia sp. Z-3]MED5802248.1 hypothetical protein [Gordonia sp. Z-3]
MRTERPVRGRGVVVAVGLWAAAIVVIAVTAVLVALHLNEIRVVLSLDLARDEPGATADEVVRAVNIALGVGAVLIGVVVVTAIYGCTRLWQGAGSGRGWLVVAVIAAVAVTVGAAIVTGPSSSAVAEAGLPALFQWPLPAVGSAIGALATVIAYVSAGR